MHQGVEARVVHLRAGDDDGNTVNALHKIHDVAQEKNIAKVEEIDNVQDERDVLGKSVAHAAW